MHPHMQNSLTLPHPHPAKPRAVSASHSGLKSRIASSKSGQVHGFLHEVPQVQLLTVSMERPLNSKGTIYPQPPRENRGAGIGAPLGS